MIGPDKEYTLEEWKAEAIRRFGTDEEQWKFVCPNCGHVQCGQDFIDKFGTSGGKGVNTALQECIGRYGVGEGCDYCSFGLIDSDTKVVKDGKKVPVFPFAEVSA
nr:VVA0879 family protein [uncultured Methanoregula sp.]